MRRSIFLTIICIVTSTSAWAGGPWFVEGTGTGTPYTWPNNTVRLLVEQGRLNENMDYAAAVSFINTALSTWKSVYIGAYETAKIDIAIGGVYSKNGVDDPIKTKADMDGAMDQAESNQKALVVFDQDGSLLKEINPTDADKIYAMTYYLVPAADDTTLVGGVIILNGAKIGSNKDIGLAVLIHELGHLLNLDHTDVNAQIAGPNLEGDQKTYLPTMYPIAYYADQKNLHMDDRVAISSLYPTKYFSTDNKFCTVQGKIIGSNGKEFQGVDVAAMNVGSKQTDIRSQVSGVYYPPNWYRGDYHLWGLLPGYKYQIIFDEVTKFGLEASGLEPFPNNPKTGFGSGIITYGGGVKEEITCAKAGMVITMDTLELSVPATGQANVTPDPGNNGGGDTGSPATGKSGCSLRRSSTVSDSLTFLWLAISVIPALVARRRTSQI